MKKLKYVKYIKTFESFNHLNENFFKNLLDKITGKKKEPVKPGEFDGLTDEQAQEIYNEIKSRIGKPTDEDNERYLAARDQDATSMMISSHLQTLNKLEDKFPNIDFEANFRKK